MEQQKSAFYYFQLDTLPLCDFLKLSIPFKPKNFPEFPPPEYIYKKRYPFLPAALEVIHSRKKIGKEPPVDSFLGALSGQRNNDAGTISKDTNGVKSEKGESMEGFECYK